MAKKKKTLPKIKADLQKVFNRYIRLRDTDDGYGTCISCSKGYHITDLDAGHYYATKGYDSLRFDENNVHSECIGCNRFNESHLIGYGINLLEKIGEVRLSYLHDMAADYKKNGYKWDREDLNDMILYYKSKIKEVE